MRPTRIAAALLAAAVLVPTVDLRACCMMPAGARGRIAQSGQQAVIFHYGNRQELVLHVDTRIDAESTPDRIAWVVTLPDEPAGYRVERKELFEETLDWAMPLVRPPTDEDRRALREEVQATVSTGFVPSELEFGALAKVGPYTIQPVRAVGVEALGALNDWLTENEFPLEDREHMEYFVSRGFTFLAIEVLAPEGEDAVGIAPKTPPLQMSFETDRPYYPLRFSSRMGPLDLDIVMLTDRLLDADASKDVLDRLGWRPEAEGYLLNVPVDGALLPGTARVVFSESAFDTLTPPETWYLNVLRPRQVNADNTLADWPEDVFFELRDPGLLDVAPWMPVALLVVVLAGGGLLFWRSRRNG